MKKVWIVSEFFAPEETATAHILTKIANHISEHYDVNVITGPAFYENNKSKEYDDVFIQETLSKVNVQRVSNTNLDKNKLITRILRFIILTWKLTIKLGKNVKKRDAVFIVTNPAPLLLFISLLKKIKGFPVYILVHDVFPENTIPAKILKSRNNIVYKILEKIFRKAYKSADKLIVLGRDMKQIILEKIGEINEDKVVIIENWAESYIQSKDKSENGKIDIQYAGNIGRVQGIMNVLEIFSEIENDKVELTLWGSGALVDQVENFVLNNKRANVFFNGGYSRKEQNFVLNSTDISIVTLADGMFGLGVPSKTYNILASGRPILFIGDLNSEIALMINEYKCGVCFEPSDLNGLKQFIETLSLDRLEELKIMGKKARMLSETKYSEKNILDKYIKIFE